MAKATKGKPGKEKGGKKFDASKALAAAQKLWRKAKKKMGERTKVVEFDDGRYLARLVGAKLEKSNAGRAQIRFVWKFVEGEYEGKEKWAFQGIETEDNLTFLCADLDRLGYDVEEIDDLVKDLPGILAELEKAKPVCRISLKTKDGSEYQNVYISKLMSTDEEDEDEEDEDSDEEDSDDDDEEEDEDEEEEEDDEEDEDEEDEDDAEEDEDADSDDEDDEEEEEDEDDDESEEEEEEDDEAATDVTVGCVVTFKNKKGKKEKGEVLDLDEDDEEVQIQTEAGKKVTVGVDSILKVEPPAKKAKAKKGKK